MDIGKALKQEITRIARIESNKAATAPGKRAADLRRQVADLRRRLDAMEKAAKAQSEGKPPARKAQEEAGIKTAGAWFTGAGVRSLRERLNLTQKELAHLCGVTQKSVSNWETVTGKLTLRSATLKALVGARAMTAKKAKKALSNKK